MGCQTRIPRGACCGGEVGHHRQRGVCRAIPSLRAALARPPRALKRLIDAGIEGAANVAGIRWVCSTNPRGDGTGTVTDRYGIGSTTGGWCYKFFAPLRCLPRGACSLSPARGPGTEPPVPVRCADSPVRNLVVVPALPVSSDEPPSAMGSRRCWCTSAPRATRRLTTSSEKARPAFAGRTSPSPVPRNTATPPLPCRYA